MHNIVSKKWKTNAKNMKKISAPPELGIPAISSRGSWVQTERKAHEAWARFCIRKPTASAVLHHLVAQMGHQNAVVISQKILAQLLGVTDRTIRTAVSDLVSERWVQVLRIGRGKEAAYVVNDRVAWGQSRDQLRLSVFSATVVVDRDDQESAALDNTELRRIPTLYPGERQLPSGPSSDPPAQTLLDGFEPDLPFIDRSTGEVLPVIPPVDKRKLAKLDADLAKADSAQAKKSAATAKRRAKLV